MLQYLDGQPGKVCSHTILRIYWPENNRFSSAKRNRNEHHWELPYVICLTVFFHNRSSYKVSLLQRRQSPCINIGLLNHSVPKRPEPCYIGGYHITPRICDAEAALV